MPDAGRTHGPPAAKKQAAVTTGSAEHRHSPRNGFNAYTWSPWCAGLFGHHYAHDAYASARHQRRDARTPRLHVRQPAFVCREPNVHRIPASRVVTIARNAPLNEAGWREIITISEKKKAKYFPRGLDSTNRVENASETNSRAHANFSGSPRLFWRPDRANRGVMHTPQRLLVSKRTRSRASAEVAVRVALSDNPDIVLDR